MPPGLKALSPPAVPFVQLALVVSTSQAGNQNLTRCQFQSPLHSHSHHPDISLQYQARFTGKQLHISAPSSYPELSSPFPSTAGSSPLLPLCPQHLLPLRGRWQKNHCHFAEPSYCSLAAYHLGCVSSQGTFAVGWHSLRSSLQPHKALRGRSTSLPLRLLKPSALFPLSTHRVRFFQRLASLPNLGRFSLKTSRRHIPVQELLFAKLQILPPVNASTAAF